MVEGHAYDGRFERQKVALSSEQVGQGFTRALEAIGFQVETQDPLSDEEGLVQANSSAAEHVARMDVTDKEGKKVAIVVGFTPSIPSQVDRVTLSARVMVEGQPDLRNNDYNLSELASTIAGEIGKVQGNPAEQSESEISRKIMHGFNDAIKEISSGSSS